MPCRKFVWLLFDSLEATLRRQGQEFRRGCVQTTDEKVGREGVSSYEVRLINRHAVFAYQRIQAMEYLLLQIAECRYTKNWGHCDGCSYCINYFQPLNNDLNMYVNPIKYPLICEAYEFYSCKCRHALQAPACE